MNMVAENPDKKDRANAPSAPAVGQSEARAAREQLHVEADVGRRAAIHARLTAERARLATYTRARRRP